MNPYLVLGVAPEADDATIRQAYLAAVRLTPPETHPDRFKEIAAAYEAVKDEASRHRYTLFNTECSGDSPLDAFLLHARLARPPAPLSFEAMKELLRQCAKS